MNIIEAIAKYTLIIGVAGTSIGAMSFVIFCTCLFIINYDRL